MRLGFLELVVILAIVLLIVGPKQLPKLMNAVSDSVKQFKSEFKGDKGSNEIEEKEE